MGCRAAWVLILSLAAPSVLAQETPPTYIFATYYRCNQATEQRADALFKETVAPTYKKEVAAGRIGAYGWATHWLGGEWRRLEYTTGRDLDKMVDARQALIESLLKNQRQAADEFSSICPSHDDYVWVSVVSSQPPDAIAASRTAVANSTYFECDVSREEEADEIVKSAYAPILNEHVREGKIVSWNWLRHMMGGKYRRILVFDGTDHKSVLNYWSSLAGRLSAAHPRQSERFSSICSAHTDYVWDIPKD
jgi:hypothetical protein